MTILQKNRNFYLYVGLLALSFFSLSLCTDNNEFYIGGQFLEVYEDSNGNLQHSASLVAYSFDTELLDDDFDGVYSENDILSTFVATPSGIFASGPFKFVDYDYSNTVTQYDADDDEWTSLNEGIWCDDCVRFIAGVGDIVFFAGKSNELTTLETLPGVNVDGIVAMNVDTEEYSALSDPNDVFPASPKIEGLAGSPVSSELYIYEASSNAIYSYNVDEGSFQLLFSNFAMTLQNETLLVANNGDLYVFAYTLDSENVTLSLYYWPANYSVGMEPEVLPIKKVAISSMICAYPMMTAYLDGVLISIPDPAAEVPCQSSFSYVNGGVKQSPGIPPSTAPVAFLSGGDNDEVWIAEKITDYWDPNLKYNHLYYWNSSLTHWMIISLSSENIDTYSITFMTYLEEKSSLYLYLLDYDGGGSDPKLVRVKSEDLDVVLKSPGSLSSPGLVSGLAYDPDNDALFVGGSFSGVGKSGAQNFAYYSFKEKDWQGLETGRVEGLTSIGSTIYLIYSQCGNINEQLPFNAYSISNSDVDVRNNLPIFYEDNSCLSSIASNSSHIYIGGPFVAQLNLELAYGLVIYDVEHDEWSTLPIPEGISTSEATWDINAIVEFEYDDVSYLVFGGTFSFIVGENTFVNIALYNLDSQSWVDIAPPNLLDVNSIVYMYDGVLILAGTAVPGASTAAVLSYNISTSAYETYPGLHSVVTSLLLYTATDNDDNPEWTTIYAGGHSPTGVSASNYTTPSWVPIGDVYNNMYEGYATTLLYSTGGNGQGGVNGDSSGGSSDWWWITLIVLGSLILIAAIIIVLAAVGYFVYQRRRGQYTEL